MNSSTGQQGILNQKIYFFINFNSLGRVKEKVVLPQAPASTFLTRISKVYAAMDFSSVDKMESQST